MSGIGIIIILLQSLPFLGAPVASGGPMEAVKAWPPAVGSFNINAFGIAAVTLLVGVAWPKRFHRFLPPSLAALIFGMLLAILWLQRTPIIGQVPTGLPQIYLPAFSINMLFRLCNRL